MNRITLILEPADDGQPDMTSRTKKLLKQLLRQHRIRCVGGSVQDDAQLGAAPGAYGEAAAPQNEQQNERTPSDARTTDAPV